MNKYLDLSDVADIVDSIEFRQAHFDGEPFATSVAIVLLNYGSKYVPVSCVGREWSGTKGDLEPGDGIPHCPNGHVLIETDQGPRLALSTEPIPSDEITA